MKLHRKENNCIASAPLEGKTTVSRETRTEEGREGKCIGGLLLEIVLGAVILSFIAMSLYCTRYITYQADDFSYMMWNQSIQDQNPTLSYLHVELWSAWNLYKGWQGTWFTNVLVYLLYGLQSYGIEAFRWTCLIIDLAFFTSLLYLSWELVSFFHTRNRWRWWLFLISVFIWGGAEYGLSGGGAVLDRCSDCLHSSVSLRYVWDWTVPALCMDEEEECALAGGNAGVPWLRWSADRHGSFLCCLSADLPVFAQHLRASAGIGCLWRGERPGLEGGSGA